MIIRFFIAAFTLFFLQQSVNGQSDRIVKEYFRVNPFSGSFPAFVKALTTDPALVNPQIVLKTDSTNFFVRGTYKIFNPFSFNAEKVDMLFSENEYNVASSRMQQKYTSYSYQIIAFFDDTKSNRTLLMKDFKRLKRKLDKPPLRKEIVDLKGVREIEDGEIVNYYGANSLVYPYTLSWQTLPSSKKLAITLITRLEVFDNFTRPAGVTIFPSYRSAVETKATRL